MRSTLGECPSQNISTLTPLCIHEDIDVLLAIFLRIQGSIWLASFNFALSLIYIVVFTRRFNADPRVIPLHLFLVLGITSITILLSGLPLSSDSFRKWRLARFATILIPGLFFTILVLLYIANYISNSFWGSNINYRMTAIYAFRIDELVKELPIKLPLGIRAFGRFTRVDCDGLYAGVGTYFPKPRPVFFPVMEHIAFSKVGLVEISQRMDLYYDGASSKKNSINDDNTLFEGLEKVPDYAERPAFFYFHLMSPHHLGTKFPEYCRYLPADKKIDPAAMMTGGYGSSELVDNYDDKVTQTDGVACLNLWATRGT
jgi:hypothetical protein